MGPMESWDFAVITPFVGKEAPDNDGEKRSHALKSSDQIHRLEESSACMCKTLT